MIIGMIHLKALFGYPQHSSHETVLNAALYDARALVAGGVDAILIENTDDDPHQITVQPEVIAEFTLVAKAVKDAVSVPIGICVLFNDYKASLAIAKAVGATFVRIPVFTEAVVTASGLIIANPYDVITYRRHIAAENIKLYVDIQVKHAAMLAKRPIGESCQEAVHFGADKIIITGKYTGDAPIINDLAAARIACPEATIVVGSGMTPENLPVLGKYADEFIVGTYFKPNGVVDTERVRTLMRKRVDQRQVSKTPEKIGNI